MAAVEIIGLKKSYGKITAVKDVSFSVNPGEILGIIGPNGAGKSTTIKILLDFIKADSGEVRLFNGPMSEELKNKIGYLPEERGLYKHLTALELILYLASLKGIGKKVSENKALELLKKTGMLEYKDKKNKEMSKGMGQLIQFISTIIHEPDLIILDEPFSGLDPVRTEAVQNIIADFREQGKAIILSTHQMNKVEELCNRVLMINKGNTILYGEISDIRAQFRKNSIQLEIEGDLEDLPGVIEKKEKNGSIELILAPEQSPQDILDHILNQDISIHRFEISTPSLNEIFLDLVGAEYV
jgi:ABC-2 type transport system ATP-binding protein